MRSSRGLPSSAWSPPPVEATGLSPSDARWAGAVERLDEQAWDLQEQVERGNVERAEHEAAFHRARAASAAQNLADPGADSADGAYEAVHALPPDADALSISAGRALPAVEPLGGHQPVVAARAGQTARMLHVWIDAWQMQCCGDPFGVGDTVRWALVEDHWEELLRDDAGATETLHLTHREEHHGGVPDDTPLTAGVVRRALAVFFEYVEDPEQARMVTRAAGPGRARERPGRVDGWEPGDSPPGRGPQFDGYVVVLEPVGG